MGFEPTIFGTTIRRFNQLSYTHHMKKIGAPCWIRTSGLLLRRQLLYPAELKAHLLFQHQADWMERVMGIEPTCSAWKADILPLNYTRNWRFNSKYYSTRNQLCQGNFVKKSLCTILYKRLCYFWIIRFFIILILTFVHLCGIILTVTTVLFVLVQKLMFTNCWICKRPAKNCKIIAKAIDFYWLMIYHILCKRMCF